VSLPIDRRAALERQAFAILASGGGWNPRTRDRLAALAQANGVDVAELMDALVESMRAGSSEASASVAEASASAAPVDVIAPNRGRGLGLLAGLVILLVALTVSVLLVIYALHRAGLAAKAPATPVPSSAGSAPGVPSSDPARPRAPEPQPRVAEVRDPAVARRSGRSAPPVPAIYSRPPALRVDDSPAWARTALESIAADESELFAMQSRLASGVQSTDADRAAWRRMSEALVSAWPLLDGRRRDAALDAIVSVLPRLGDVETRRGLLSVFAEFRDADGTMPDSLWRGAGSAGLLAALEHPGTGPALAFGEAALAWLAPRTGEVCDAVLRGDPAAAADAVDAWLQATEAATTGALRDERDPRILGLLDLLLRRGATMDRPGTSADAAGTLLDALSWTGSPVRRSRIEGALRAWFEDPAVSAQSLHGLTSVLAARRPGSWWEPWLVSDARADMASRTFTADRFRAALAAAPGEVERTEGPRIRGVRPEAVDRWIRVSRLALARAPGADPALRVAHAAELLAMVEAVRLLERGRISDAEARIAQVEDPEGIAPDDLDRWKGRVERTPGRTIGADGRLDQELRNRASIDDKLAFVRAFRTRAIGDLGPIDAAVLAREALASPSTQMRSVAQGVVADVFGAGPNVVAAVAAEVPSAVDAGEAASLAGSLAGQPAPRGGDDARRAASVLLLLDHHASLVPSDRNRLDSVAQEFVFSANAVVGSLGGTELGSRASPDAALRAWFDAALADARAVLPPAAFREVSAAAEARRRLAAPGPQAAVAELASLLGLDAAVLAERAPRRRAVAESIVARASADRSVAPDAFAQLQATCRALLQLALESVAPEGGES
jgi:hypothetical protein